MALSNMPDALFPTFSHGQVGPEKSIQFKVLTHFHTCIVIKGLAPHGLSGIWRSDSVSG